MIRLPKHDEITSRKSKSSGYDVESLLGYPSLPTTSQTTTASKLTAKVQPFEVKENDLMESSNPRPENAFPKGHQNPPFHPSLGYPSFGSPLALANLHLYSLWQAQAQAHAGLVNWPLIHHANPVFTQALPRPQNQSNSSDSNLNNTSRTQNTVKHPSTEDTSINSNSATESLLAASECHLAVLRDDDGDTPLHIAIVHENQRLIEKLIGLISLSKMTVNTPNNLSQTALHLAVLTKQPLVVQQLMNAGADANAQDRNGQTAIHLCAANGDIRCLHEIKSAKSKRINLEIKNFDGLTALHLAVQKKHQNVVEALIQYGANIDVKDGKSGHTPLHHAIDHECCEILQLLVAKGANINKPNYSGVSPVQNANCCRNEAISKIILSQETAAPVTTTINRPSAIQPTATASTWPKTTNMPISAMNGAETNREREMSKRRNESSPSTSKRSRTEIGK
ncbi:NF-kappa-B inhibitor epsilon-like isoform X2 [Dendronephthya gigantea]|uniref:NF-kappa-B inhibitor epsilon-like isoform X2 n=1 Tax=Dendronephthya gigantea TaxID=151771 RepID=UPI0010690FE5|nr:NF-kappa-B inhibitor epsilon-like isoform X2 [Dendronephthya gigantea]